MKKKILSLCLVVAMVATAVAGASMAFLTDEDSDVNVMTLGNVDIEQKEDFEQGADLFPGCSVEKLVTVENVGETDVYFRTLIAFEDIDSDTFGVDFPIVSEEYTHATQDGGYEIEIDGVKYVVHEFVYNGTLAAGATSAPSLTKVELSAASTNEDMEALGGTYEVLVLSQAVQAAGFSDATTALDTAFGKVAEKAEAWFTEVLAKNSYIEEIPEGATVISTAEEFMALSGTKANGVYYLANDIDLSGAEFTSMYVYDSTTGADVTFIGNGYTISNVTFVSEKENGMNNVGLFHVGAGNYGTKGNSLTIRNLTVENAVVTGTVEYCDAGVIVSYINGSNTVSLTNVDVVNSSVMNSAGNAGLLVGYTNSPLTLTDCDVSGTVNGKRTDKTGGLVGTVNGVTTVTNCTNATGVPNFGRDLT